MGRKQVHQILASFSASLYTPHLGFIQYIRFLQVWRNLPYLINFVDAYPEDLLFTFCASLQNIP